jgi:transposase InsO family protein
MHLRDAMQRIALEMPSYGRPRITAELRRRGWMVNPKRVYRIMREDNLLCLRRRKFIVTTDSRHGFRVYPNVAPESGCGRMRDPGDRYICLLRCDEFYSSRRASIGSTVAAR